MAFFPARIEGLGASNSCRTSPMTQAEGGRDGGRERFRWPECTPGRPLTHSLTHSGGVADSRAWDEHRGLLRNHVFNVILTMAPSQSTTREALMPIPDPRKLFLQPSCQLALRPVSEFAALLATG